ncbi:MAG: SDR family oxidoreductase [Archangium sp.]|nr:SDR family oxidoreductase [Archangium sp.]MDP3151810.1 SDR family oxidoreductase [Archangium sp.]MDP3573328.1 SDR family oxidoreductase [Archangium sp.]
MPLIETKSTWLVTGGAGFIGSHLVETLLREGQRVVALDSLVTGYQRNLDDAVKRAGEGAASRFTFHQGDITSPEHCQAACAGVDYVLHQAALGSVPRSIALPLDSHRANVDGFVNMLIAARDAKVKRFVFASSSSVYGDDPTLPKVESRTGRVLSPYAATKHINEVYASVFQRTYGIETIGLRYFNVFGPRQDPNGAYAAVIPRWMAALVDEKPCLINGDGSTSRDFCFVSNAVQANLRAALTQVPGATDAVYNVAVGGKTSLLELYELIRTRLAKQRPSIAALQPVFQPFRAGDIKDSQADISRAREKLGYAPTHTVAQGMDETVAYVTSGS